MELWLQIRRVASRKCSPARTDRLACAHMVCMHASPQLPVAKIQQCSLTAARFFHTKPEVEAPPARYHPPPCFFLSFFLSHIYTHTRTLWRGRRSAVGWILTTKEQWRARRGAASLRKREKGKQQQERYINSHFLKKEAFAVRATPRPPPPHWLSKPTSVLQLQERRGTRCCTRRWAGRGSVTLDFHQGSGTGDVQQTDDSGSLAVHELIPCHCHSDVKPFSVTGGGRLQSAAEAHLLSPSKTVLLGSGFHTFSCP